MVIKQRGENSTSLLESREFFSDYKQSGSVSKYIEINICDQILSKYDTFSCEDIQRVCIQKNWIP